MKGSTFKRCTCPPELDSRGRRKACRKDHGSWTFVADLGADPVTGKRRQVRRSGFATQTEAHRALSDHLAEVATGSVSYDGRITVAAYLGEWLAGKAGGDTRPTTLRSYEQHVETYLVPHLGRVRLGDLTAVHVEKMLRSIAGSGARGRALSPSTVRRVHATLRSALGSAKRKRLVRTNVAEDVELPRSSRPRVHPWEPAELGAFLDHAAGTRLGALFEVAAFTGLRRGELCGLRWPDVDVARARLVVHQQVVQVGSAGPCTWCAEVHRSFSFGPPKTAAGENRVVDLSAEVVGVLMAHRIGQEVEREQWGTAYREHGLVFAREDGSPLSPDKVGVLFQQLTAEAGLRRVRLHDLRHGQASLMLAAGVPLAVVSKRLGHSSLALTSDTYSHLLEGVGLDAAERSERLVPRASRDHSVTTRSPEGASGDAVRIIVAGQDGGPRRARTDDQRIKSP